MLILITNDDGIESPGLSTLREIGTELGGEVWTCAPDTNHSGAGHSLSLNHPIRVRRVDDREYAVSGTPTDSVIMGLHHVLSGRTPDLILSGVNRGTNLAEDVTYSGTIAACLEGTLLGIRSVALSLAISKETKASPHWPTPKRFAPDIIRKLLALTWAPSSLYSLNFPDCGPDQVAGVTATVQGRRDAGLLKLDERQDPWGNPYFWLAYSRSRTPAAAPTDLWAIANNRISVTPLSVEMTHRPSVDATRHALGDTSTPSDV